MNERHKQVSDLKQHYEALHQEVVEILLGSGSPIRGNSDFDELIAKHDRLVAKQADLRQLEMNLVQVLPGLEEAEANLTESKTQLVAGKKTLEGFAAELGRSAFEGLRAGELPDHPIFNDRKDLQSRIETLKRQRSELSVKDNSGLMESAKVQAQMLKLAGQIKVEEIKVGSADRVLGKALLTSKEKVTVRCDQTIEVLEAIARQRDQVATTRDHVQNCEESYGNRRKTAAQALGRTSVQAAVTLQNELNDSRKELRRNAGELRTTLDTLVAKALETSSLCDGEIAGQQLRQLGRLKSELAASKPQWLKLIDDATLWFLGLPKKKQIGVSVAAGTAALVLFIAILTGGGNGSSPNPAATTQPANPKEVGNGPVALSEADTLRELERLGAKITEDKDGVTIFFNSETKVTSLPPLEPIASLHGLIINSGSLAGDKLAAIENVKNLSGLVLNDCQIDDEALIYVKDLRSLRILVLNNNDITGQALHHLSGLPELRILGLRRAKIDDSSLQHLRGLTKLQELDLSLTPITGSGLVVTEHMPNLRQLDLHTCLLLEGLPTNSGDETLSRLEDLNLQGCVKLSPASAKQFKGRRKVRSAIENLAVRGNRSGQFSYRIGDTVYQGLSERESRNGTDVEHVFASTDNSGPSAAIIDWKKRIVTSGMLGVQEGKLTAGPGRDGMILTFAFKIRDPGDVAKEKNPGRTLASNLLIAEDRYRFEEGVSGEVTPCGVYVKWMNRGPGFDKQPFWGRAASRVPRSQQVLGFDNGGGIPILSLGEPIRVSAGSGFDTAEYGDLSPALVWSLSRKVGDWQRVRFVAGSRVYEMDDSAKQVLNLVARAVAVVRYSEGYRVDSQKTLGD